MADEIRDNTKLGRFELEAEGAVSFLTYRPAKSAIVLVHMEVPPAHQGHGIATRLASGVLELLRREGRKAVVACPFVAGYIRKHPEYDDILAVPLRDKDHDQLDARLDEALAESFPASDPVAVTPDHLD
ncbi:MAG: GNAT family N-acetyltransferase [Rhizomicrobium sp.]